MRASSSPRSGPVPAMSTSASGTRARRMLAASTSVSTPTRRTSRRTHSTMGRSVGQPSARRQSDRVARDGEAIDVHAAGDDVDALRRHAELSREDVAERRGQHDRVVRAAIHGALDHRLGEHAQRTRALDTRLLAPRALEVHDERMRAELRQHGEGVHREVRDDDRIRTFAQPRRPTRRAAHACATASGADAGAKARTSPREARATSSLPATRPCSSTPLRDELVDEMRVDAIEPAGLLAEPLHAELQGLQVQIPRLAALARDDSGLGARSG